MRKPKKKGPSIDVIDKGQRTERELCKILERYFDEPFERVLYSGSYVGGSNRDRLENPNSNLDDMIGDIRPPANMDMVIEVKGRGRDYFHWDRIMKGKYPQMDEWIAKIKIDAGDKFWMLCFNVDYTGWFALVEADIYGCSSSFSSRDNHTNLYYNINEGTALKYRDYMIYDLENFLKYNSDAIKEHTKKEVI